MDISRVIQDCLNRTWTPQQARVRVIEYNPAKESLSLSFEAQLTIIHTHHTISISAHNAYYTYIYTFFPKGKPRNIKGNGLVHHQHDLDTQLDALLLEVIREAAEHATNSTNIKILKALIQAQPNKSFLRRIYDRLCHR